MRLDRDYRPNSSSEPSPITLVRPPSRLTSAARRGSLHGCWCLPRIMPNTQSQAKILAQGIYEIRLLLAGYLGSQNAGDPVVRRAAHLAYALHNEALSVIEGGTFDGAKAVDKVRAVDRMFEESFATRFQPHVSNGS